MASLLLSLLLNLISVANASALLILFPLRRVGLLPFTAPFVQPSMANFLLLLILVSVKFRVNPWLVFCFRFCLILFPWLMFLLY